MSSKLTAIWSALCLCKQYAGRLCTACADGYGSSRDPPLCLPCYSKNINTFLYILTGLINVVFITFTVRLSLPDIHTEALRKQEERRAHADSIIQERAKKTLSLDDKCSAQPLNTHNLDAEEQHVNPSLSAPLRDSIAVTEDFGSHSLLKHDSANYAALPINMPDTGSEMHPSISVAPDILIISSPMAEDPDLSIASKISTLPIIIGSALTTEAVQSVTETLNSTTQVEISKDPSSTEQSAYQLDTGVAYPVKVVAEKAEGGEAEEVYRGGEHGVVIKIMMNYMQVRKLIMHMLLVCLLE